MSDCDEDDVSGSEQEQEQQTESEVSDLDSLAGSSASGATKIRFRKREPWTRIATFNKMGKSEEELQACILQVSTDQLKPFLPEQHTGIVKTLDTDLYLWKRKDIYVARKIEQLVTYRCPLAYACNCRCMLRVTTTECFVVVYFGPDVSCFAVISPPRASST